jgi:serine protease
MKRSAVLVAVFVATGLSVRNPVRARQELRVAGRTAPSTRPQKAAYKQGEVIVKFRDGAGEAEEERTIRAVGGTRATRARYAPPYRVTLADGANVALAVSLLRAQPSVEYAEPNLVVRKLQASTFVPNDRYFPAQWNLKIINAERAWAIQKGSAQVAVAVLDTGIAYENYGRYAKAPDWGDLAFLPGIDVINGGSHPNDDEFHGTHVASTVAEATNNGLGVAGLAFGCSLMPVKVLDENGEGSVFEVAEGIDYVTNFRQGGTNPVKVINLSLGGPDASDVLKDAVNRAFVAGIVLVAAAGNDDRSGIDYPAAYPNVIAVGAVDQRKQKAPYSNHGAQLSVVAPGGDVDRDDDGDGNPDAIFQQMPDPDLVSHGIHDQFCYCGLDGTSMAAPHVSAMAAMLVSQGITDPAAVRAAIESTAEDLGTPGRDDQYGHGLIQPAKALTGLGINK